MNTKQTYAEKLRDPRWQKMRLQILERDRFTCMLCGDMDTELHVHHAKYGGNPWEVEPEDLFTLCKHCHTEVEELKARIDFRELSIYKLTGCDGKSDRVMLISLEDITLMRIYDITDRLISSIELGLREMSLMETAFELATQKRPQFGNRSDIFDMQLP